MVIRFRSFFWKENTGKFMPFYLILCCLCSPLHRYQDDNSMTDSIPVIRNESDFKRYLNYNKVRLVGTYQIFMMPRSKRPNSPVFESCRVKIVLSDNFSIAIETHDSGIRTEEERIKFRNKTVKVTGKPYAWAQLWGEVYEQAIVSPAVKEIESIEEME
jgi:hypothetical protein